MKTTAVILLLMLILAMPAFALGVDEADELISDIMDTVPDEYRDEIGVVTGDGESELLDIGHLITEFFDSIADTFLPSVGHMGELMCILVLSSLLKITVTSLSQSDLRDRLLYITKAATVLCLYVNNSAMIDEFSAFIGRICTYMNSVVPVMTAVYCASGNVTTAGVSAGGLMLLITLIDNILVTYGTLWLKISLAFVLISSVAGDITSRFLANSKKLLAWGFGLMMGIYALVMGIQTSLARSADSISMRTVKFAVGRSVPLVGGAISDALSTVSAGLSLIKSTCGTVVIVVILLMFLPMLAALAGRRISLWLASLFGSLLDIGDETALINEFMSVNAYLIAMTGMTAVMFIYVMTLFLSVTPAMGG